MIKKLTEAFPSLRITDSEINEVKEDIYAERIVLRKKEHVLFVNLSSSHPIHRRVFEKLQREITRQITRGEVKVVVTEKFRLSRQYTLKYLFEEYKDSILYELHSVSPILSAVFKSSDADFTQDDVLEIRMPDSIFYEENAERLTGILTEILNVRCGMNCRVSIRSSVQKSSRKSHADQILENAAKDLSGRSAKAEAVQQPEPEASEAKQEKKKGRGEKTADPDLLYGRPFTDEDVTPLSEIDQYSGRVTVRGDVFGLDSKETKSGKIILTFNITDYTDSVKVKIFSDAEGAAELSKILSKGVSVKIKGTAALDSFDHETGISSVYGMRRIPSFRARREDLADEKYIELHCHTKMSDMDGMADAKDLVKQAYRWGQPAIAITDHGVVQAFPIANGALQEIDEQYRDRYAKEHPDAAKEEIKSVTAPFKVLYGVEAYLVDDLKRPVRNADDRNITEPVVVFDIETTGFSPISSKIIEIGAVKLVNGTVEDRFSSFVNPGVPIPYKIEKLTGINDAMVLDAPDISEVLPEFLKFCDGCFLAAHNSDFDCGFIKKNCADLGQEYAFISLDTVALARCLLPELKNYRLETVAKKLEIPLDNHHRAVDDAACTAQIFLELQKLLKEREIHTLKEVNEAAVIDAETVKKLPTYHAVILVKNETGRVNLYRLISLSHIEYFHMRPRIPKSVYKQYSEGLIISPACESGELYQAMLRGASDQELADIAAFYDYLEIQPVGNNRFMIRDENIDSVSAEEDIKDLNRKVVSIAEQLGKIAVATGDVHFKEPEDEIYRRILQAGMGFADADEQAPLYQRTTEEMLREFEYFGTEKARELVLENPAKIAALCERISPIRKGKFPPVIENSDADLRAICYSRAHELYGEDLPEVVKTRLERELTSIISNGYAVMYMIAQKLVAKSNADGYLVGSRGSVGSSFVATMAGITEVNPLSPHYLCPECHYVDFDSEEVRAYAGRCGLDMPDKECPVCGARLQKLGFDIPFETFLGFKGNKEPDIDLNFSGEYQSKAHKYTEVIFGEGQTFRAGTISTLKDKTAYGFVKKYFESKGIVKRSAETDRIVMGCTGVRRSTGQHPGGIIVLPHGEDINSFTPVQRPANDMTTDIVTTHFEYHSIDQNLLKLDILGHDDPTMIRMLKDLTGIDPLSIALDDPGVMSLFTGTRALGVTPEEIGGCPLGCLGIPEFGTEFVIQMLVDTKPTTFSELVRISGLSHGTDVWRNNAQELIAEGKATLSTAICTRDDIMTFLILKGLESEKSFTIMESVRKGKGLKPDWEEDMTAHDVPDWYIWSCKKIKYMFPKAHAAAYVMMAYRIAWYKINYPLAYYAAFFTIRATAFNYGQMCMGKERLQYFLDGYINSEDKKKADEDIIKDMKIVREMYARGIEFLPIDIYQADATKFRIIDGKLMAALNTIKDVGDNAAISIAEAAKQGPFSSKDDFRNRCRVSTKTVEYMTELGILKDLPDTDQLSIFDF